MEGAEFKSHLLNSLCSCKLAKYFFLFSVDYSNFYLFFQYLCVHLHVHVLVVTVANNQIAKY